MDSQEAVVKFRFEIDTNGIRAVNAMTGEVVKLASAEEIAREKVEAYNRAAKERAQAGVPQVAPVPTPAPPRSPAAPAPAPLPPPAARQPEPNRLPPRALPELIPPAPPVPASLRMPAPAPPPIPQLAPAPTSQIAPPRIVQDRLPELPTRLPEVPPLPTYQLPEVPTRLPIPAPVLPKAEPPRPEIARGIPEPAPIQYRPQFPVRELPPIPPPGISLPIAPARPPQPLPKLPELPIRSADWLPIESPRLPVQQPQLPTPAVALPKMEQPRPQHQIQPPPILQPAPRLIDRVNTMGGNPPPRVPGPLGISPEQIDRMNRMYDHRGPERAASENRGEMARLAREIAQLTIETRLLRETYRLGSGMGTGGGAPVRIGTSTGLGAMPGADRPEPTLRERAMAAIQREQEKREFEREIARIRQESGRGGFVSRMGGISGMGLAAGGATVAGLSLAGTLAGAHTEVMSNPWISQNERTNRFMDNVPVLGHFFGAGRNIREWQDNVGERRANAEMSNFYADIERRIREEKDAFETQQKLTESPHVARVIASRNYTPPRLVESDRSTLQGERARQEDLVRFPFQEKKAELQSQVSIADSERHTIDLRMRTLSGRMTRSGGLNDQLAEAEKTFNTEKEKSLAAGGNNSPEMMKAARNVIRIRDEIVSVMGEVSSLRPRLQEAQVEQKKKEFELKQHELTGSEWYRSHLPIWQEREQRAVSQATALGMAGPEQRAMAQQALQAIRQIGIENAPQDLTSQASSLFPEEVRKMAERAGAKMMPEFKRAAPEEYRYGVEEARNATDEIRRQIQETTAASAKEMAAAVNAIVESQLKLMAKEFAAALDGRFRFLDLQKMIENSSSNK
jgi:hypothetical protein